MLKINTHVPQLLYLFLLLLTISLHCSSNQFFEHTDLPQGLVEKIFRRRAQLSSCKINFLNSEKRYNSNYISGLICLCAEFLNTSSNIFEYEHIKACIKQTCQTLQKIHPNNTRLPAILKALKTYDFKTICEHNPFNSHHKTHDIFSSVNAVTIDKDHLPTIHLIQCLINLSLLQCHSHLAQQLYNENEKNENDIRTKENSIKTLQLELQDLQSESVLLGKKRATIIGDIAYNLFENLKKNCISFTEDVLTNNQYQKIITDNDKNEGEINQLNNDIKTEEINLCNLKTTRHIRHYYAIDDMINLIQKRSKLSHKSDKNIIVKEEAI